MKGIPHVSTKKFTGAGLAIGAATAVTALLIGSTSAYASENGTESAFGISASGLIDIEETPYVESTDGEFVEDSLLDLGIEELGLSAKVLNVTAQDGQADSEVVDLQIDDVLSAKLVRTFCFDGDGGLELVDLASADGENELKIPEDGPIKNESIDVSPLLKVTLGEQTRNADESITVTGIKITVLPVAESERENPLSEQDASALNDLLGTEFTAGLDDLGTMADELEAMSDESGMGSDEALQTITIGSATCGEIKGDGGDDDGDNGDDADHSDDADKGGDDEDVDGKGNGGDDVTAAPAPTVVEASLPVTG